jgi:uncharacterized glyoxalase superfamily protein PhnB
MADRDQFERLNDAIDAIVAGRPLPAIDPDLATLLLVAADLRELPDPRFRARLRSEFAKESDMQATAVSTSVRPYLVVAGADDLIEFLKQTFDAEATLRVPTPTGTVMHAEVRVGNSLIEMGDTAGQWKSIAPPLHAYIDDVDEAYRRAIAAGATSMYEPMDQPYGDREAGVVDRWGIEWFLATHVQDGPRPPGFGTVTPFLRAEGAEQMLTFLRDAFGAVEVERTTSPDGVIRHAEVKIGESMVEVSEAHGQWKPTTGGFHLFVDDCDAVYERALRVGATSIYAPENKPYGERSAAVADPFGNQWFIGTPL